MPEMLVFLAVIEEEGEENPPTCTRAAKYSEGGRGPHTAEEPLL